MRPANAVPSVQKKTLKGNKVKLHLITQTMKLNCITVNSKSARNRLITKFNGPDILIFDYTIIK